MRILRALSTCLLAGAAAAQIPIPPHAAVYNGYSRGFNFTAQTPFIITGLNLPLDAFQAGDTASYLVRVNSSVVLWSIGNAGAIATSIPLVIGDVVDVIGNWTPAVPTDFTAHNSYGNTAPYATTIHGVAHTLNRTGWQYDIGNPIWVSTGATGAYLAPTTGQLGRVIVSTAQTGLFANFSANVTSGTSPMVVNFTDMSFSSDPGGVTSWAWDFDGDSVIDSTAQNPTFTYPCGTFNVSLTVTDASHPANTLTKTAYIRTDDITANFSYAVLGALAVQFTDTSSPPATAWAWDLDGDSIIDSTAQNPAWVYGSPNSVNVTLTATRNCKSNTVTKQILPQQTIVSPVGSATVEGDSNNVFPFGQTTARRYMQIHSDLGATPLVITRMRFRINAPTAATTYTGTRTHDIEVYMGEAVPTAQQLPNLAFDANYASPKTTVLPRQFVTHGPTGAAVVGGPNPFTMDIVLTTPFVYTGTAPLIWEVAYFGSTSVGTMAAYDADASTSVTATSTITGTGCAPIGLTPLMTHTYTINDTAGTLLMNGTIAAGPANAIAFMGVGFSNPSAPIGLCANLYTDLTILQFLGLTSATGAYTADVATGSFILPNTGAGLALFTQAFVLDPLSTASLPVCMSNGRSGIVPAASAPGNGVTRLYNNVGGTTATYAAFSTSTVGYGLVTQFAHL